MIAVEHWIENWAWNGLKFMHKKGETLTPFLDQVFEIAYKESHLIPHVLANWHIKIPLKPQKFNSDYFWLFHR